MFLKKLLRKIIVLAIIAGLGFGCWKLYQNKKAVVKEKDEIIAGKEAEIVAVQNKIDVSFAESYSALIEELHTPTAEGAKVRTESNAILQRTFPDTSYDKGEESPNLKRLIEKLGEAAGDPSVLMMNDANYQMFAELKTRNFDETEAKKIVDLFPSIAR